MCGDFFMLKIKLWRLYKDLSEFFFFFFFFLSFGGDFCGKKVVIRYVCLYVRLCACIFVYRLG